jgi:hypothetical protein
MTFQGTRAGDRSELLRYAPVSRNLPEIQSACCNALTAYGPTGVSARDVPNARQCVAMPPAPGTVGIAGRCGRTHGQRPYTVWSIAERCRAWVDTPAFPVLSLAQGHKVLGMTAMSLAGSRQT